MIKNSKSVKLYAYTVMTLLVAIWGYEYVVAKAALVVIEPMTLVFFRYSIAATILFIVRLFQRKRFPLKKKDVISIIACAVFGEILYYWSNYAAMDYLSASIITIILAFVPLVSIVFEVCIYKRTPNTIIVIGIIICFIGVMLVIGINLNDLLSGKWIGYLLSISAVLFWNIYNFILKKLADDYEPYDLAFMQQVCTTLILLPYAIFNMPDVSQITFPVVSGTLFLGMISACIGAIMYAFGMAVLGPTPCALFTNFLPIFTAAFGWIFLSEKLSTIQIIGCIIVIIASTIVVWQKGKLDKGYVILKGEKMHKPNKTK